MLFTVNVKCSEVFRIEKILCLEPPDGGRHPTHERGQEPDKVMAEEAQLRRVSLTAGKGVKKYR